MSCLLQVRSQKGLEVCYCLWGVSSRPSPGSYPGPVQVPSRVRGGPVQLRHVLCFTVFRTHPGPEVGAIPARPGPILLPSVPYRIGPGRAETDFLATSDARKSQPLRIVLPNLIPLRSAEEPRKNVSRIRKQTSSTPQPHRLSITPVTEATTKRKCHAM